MKNYLFITAVICLLCCITKGFGQTAHEMVPLPDFADYCPELTEKWPDVTPEAVREGMSYEGGQALSYESAAVTVSVFTTDHSPAEVRQLYMELLMQQMEAQGAPPPALDQYADFLDRQVFSDTESGPVIDGDPDVMEQQYAGAGIESPPGLFDCLRELYPQLAERAGSRFLIEMDQLQFLPDEAVEPGLEYAIVEVEVENPFVNLVDCSFSEETLIIYRVYDMVITGN